MGLSYMQENKGRHPGMPEREYEKNTESYLQPAMPEK